MDSNQKSHTRGPKYIEELTIPYLAKEFATEFIRIHVSGPKAESEYKRGLSTWSIP